MIGKPFINEVLSNAIENYLIMENLILLTHLLHKMNTIWVDLIVILPNMAGIKKN